MTASGSDTVSACDAPASSRLDLGGRPLGHEPMQRDRDVQVPVAEHEPRRDLPPRRCVGGQASRQGGLGDRALRGPHDGGLRRGHVGGELLVERVLPDGELVPAGRDRVGGEGLGEGAAGEHRRELERRFPVVGREPGDVHETDHGVVAGRGLGDHDATVGVADEHDRRAEPADHVAHVGGVTRDAAQGVGRRHDREAAGLQLFDDRAPAGGLRERAVDEDDGRGLFGHGGFPRYGIGHVAASSGGEALASVEVPGAGPRSVVGSREPPSGGASLELRHAAPELPAGADVELREHLAQVVLGGARADEQLGADLGVGVTRRPPAGRPAPPGR